ncbi:MGMT family protein [Arthrobacter sp.]|uniref:MGMT family protein n=1 Tax=Arthrobacter sp. TaxID=1667 RepID=UPI00289A4FBF|nr:MGMT family protein [Arthrobacter sp.]
MREDYQEAVLATAELIPPGKVLAYGDIAEILGFGGPRQVGAVLARCGSSVPWWRVLRASGEPPACHGHRAWEHYSAEHTPVRGTPAADGTGYRVRIAEARWQPSAADWSVLDDLRRRLTVPAPAVDPEDGEDQEAGATAMANQAMSVRRGEVEA